MLKNFSKKTCFECHYFVKRSSTQGGGLEFFSEKEEGQKLNWMSLLKEEERQKLKKGNKGFLSGTYQKVWRLDCAKGQFFTEDSGQHRTTADEIIEDNRHRSCHLFQKLDLAKPLPAMDQVAEYKSNRTTEIIAKSELLISIIALIKSFF